MVLIKQEKKDLVIKLYNEGKPMKEIAKQAHMSFRDIGKITNQKEKSIETRALNLFHNGKEPIDVAIELDLSSEQVNKIYREFLRLVGLHKLVLNYYEIQQYLPQILGLVEVLLENDIDHKQVMKLVGYDRKITCLEIVIERLKKQIEPLKRQYQYYQQQILEMQNFIINNNYRY